MKKLNITPGEWIVQLYPHEIAIKTEETIRQGFSDRICTINQYLSTDNVQLIADAGTTYNQCGLRPSELLKQRDELLKKLKDINMILGAYPELEKLNDALVKRVFSQLERVAQINNAENI